MKIDYFNNIVLIVYISILDNGKFFIILYIYDIFKKIVIWWDFLVIIILLFIFCFVVWFLIDDRYIEI